MKDTFRIDKYILTFDHNIKTEIFSETQYYGIIFHMDNGKYEVMHNFDLGNRLLINLKNGANKDVPFKEETFWLLPPVINAKEME